jgi:hypothetical protein
MPGLLTSDDLDVVHETLQEIRDMPPPRDNYAAGCVMALAGLAILLVLPSLGRAFGLASNLATVGLLTGGALLVVGIIVWQTAGGFVRGQYMSAAEAALNQLEAWTPEEGDRVLALRATTLLLTHAVATYGPTSSSAFDYGEAEVRIAHMMPLVMAVQEVLVEEGAAYPIFPAEGDVAELGPDAEQGPTQ